MRIAPTIFVISFALCIALPLASQENPLQLASTDLRIEARKDGGYDLYIRKKPGIRSVLITESTKDPLHINDNFAYRAEEWNSVNGNEKRMLSGKFLPATSKLYSLISSTPMPDADFGTAFKILIPPVLIYGYPWSRSGTVSVGQGTFINLRTFSAPYGDYKGSFFDNPYSISIKSTPVQTVPALPDWVYQSQMPLPKMQLPPIAAPDSAETAVNNSIIGNIQNLLDPDPNGLDLAICFDTTLSMEPYLKDAQSNLTTYLEGVYSRYKKLRIGVVYYRDYWPDDYITLVSPFTDDLKLVQSELARAKTFGGGDIPEALFEALDDAAVRLDWQSTKRQIVFVTDASPHLAPRGKVDFYKLMQDAASAACEIRSIIVPKSVSAPSQPLPNIEKILGTIVIRNIRPAIALGGDSYSTSPGMPMRYAAWSEADLAQAKSDISNIMTKTTSDSNAPNITFINPPTLEKSDAADALPGPTQRLDANALCARAKEVGAEYLVWVTRYRYTSLTANDGSSILEQTEFSFFNVNSRQLLIRDVYWSTSDPGTGTSRFIDGTRID